MKKLDLPLYSDTLFTSFITGFLCLCVLRYYRIPLWGAVLLALCLAVLVGTGVFLFLSRRKQNKRLLQRDAEGKDKLMLHLALSSEESVKKLFLGLLTEEPTYLLFSMQPLSADEVAQKLKITEGHFSLWCNALTPEAKTLCNDFSVTVKEGTEVYFLLKEQDRLPEKYICGERKKLPFRDKIRRFVERKNARSFLISGSILLFFSLFSFFPIYYLVSGSLLLISALFIRIFG